MLSRRRFLKSAAVVGATPLAGQLQTIAASVEKPVFKTPIPIKILATNWGFEGSWDAFCAKAKTAGYDGFEAWIPRDDKERAALLDAAHKYGLEYGFLAGGWSKIYAEHLPAYESAVRLAVAQKPLYVNTHAGRDYFSFDQNRRLLETGVQIATESGVPVLCETHRSRAAFSANSTREYLDAIPGLRLTADLSHWCVVHESLLEGYEETLEMTLQRSDHIHARVGHSEGPQVNDPRAPEWADALKKHLEWWDRIIEYKVNAGAPYATFLTEFGPPTYLPALPYTRQPVANQWDINVHMMHLLRERYL
jgi:hypothetical protein